ncbi:MAG: lipopolysaccharide biosynthesis protein [Acaryochloridaceae cyanobacterium SU_2_1]|nr:lipopolysaccharide biosynthesis protein [Acaryochloridaceae cyanobacterium SU_2_1]
MNAFSSLSLKFKSINNPFAQDMGWLGSSQVINRFTRLAATVVLARCLNRHDYGLAAIIMTTNELVRVFARNGIGTRLIQVSEDRLESLCQSAYWLNWALFSALFVLQSIVAFPIAWFYHDNQLILPIFALAATLLAMPLAVVQNSLLQRQGKIWVIALSDTLQVTTENLSSLGFALAGFGVWAIVLPRLIVSPIWVVMMLKHHPWRPKGGFTTVGWRELLNFGRSILGVELLNTLRFNLDYLLVGRFLGVDALGVYFFAFNAGLGLSMGLITSVKVALLPRLCQARSQLDQFRHIYFKSLKTITWVFVPIVLLQASLAPFYVPLVFGKEWTAAVPILVLVCLSAIPRPFADAASQLLLAVDRPGLDLAWNVIFTGLFTGSILIGVQNQSLGVATAVLLSHSILLPLFTIWATRFVFRRLAIAQAPSRS